MRIGLSASVAVHAIILLWGLVSLPGAKPFEVAEVEAVPVDIITEVTNVSQGSKKAERKETQSQGVAKPPKPNPEAKKAGNAPKDLDAPPTPKPSTEASVREAAPPPSPTPAPKAPEPPAPPPEPAPPKPAEAKAEPKPPEPAKPVEKAPAPTTDVAELAPPEKKPQESKPEPKTEPKPEETAQDNAPPAPAVKPRVKPAPPKPIETASAEPQDTTPKKPAKPAKDTSKVGREDSTSNFDPEQIENLLNKVDPSGGGALASDQTASLGTATGRDVGQMTANELEALRARIFECWVPPVGANTDGIRVPIRMTLNPDGSLNGPPEALEIPGGPYGQVVAEAALRAIRRCAPYDFMPPEKFDQWSVVNINFTPPSAY
ncbi:hypothetical protein HDIA_3602 [Hartmannibacter diazotrophicus]|uniref:Protein TolA n=1 Tax=Hartmannibacter diazotrophicus TaxID=1482074 RepID=A0A2C9DA90_9HYPH|nr:cell envelope biogenesis protein TolA [Hartmannibacter diazotrophicus]SON57143.1 hypothetical protein HDIA_3602 [Hartmannibacter diazotrophicus]